MKQIKCVNLDKALVEQAQKRLACVVSPEREKRVSLTGQKEEVVHE